MSAPRRKHSKPHLPSIPQIEQIDSIDLIDLSPTPFEDTPDGLSAAAAGLIIQEMGAKEALVTALEGSDFTVLSASEAAGLLLPPEEEGSAGQFAFSSPAYDAGVAQPPPEHKLIPVLNGSRRIAVPKRIDKLQEEAISSMCTREELQRALAACEALHIQRFLADLTNLKYADRGIAFLARKHGITPLELADLWRRHALAKGMMTFVGQFPQVAEHIMQDSLSKMGYCQRCDGIGDVVDERAMNQAKSNQAKSLRPEGEEVELIYRKCPQCDGIGKIRIEGSGDARKLALEAAGIIGKKANTIINPTIHAHNVESVIGELETLQYEAKTQPGGNRLRLESGG